MSNIFKFQKPANQHKKGMAFSTKIIIAILFAMVIIKLPMLVVPKIYRDNEVRMITNPIKIPGDYLVMDLSGREQKLSGMLGNKITVLVFWATWCGYCKIEMPQMDEVIPELEKHGVTIIPIARGDDTPPKVVEFFDNLDMRNVESKIATTSELHKVLGVQGYPTFIAVDENGMAFARMRPNWSSADISELFDKLIEDTKIKP